MLASLVIAAPYDEAAAEIVGTNDDVNSNGEPKSLFLLTKLALLGLLFG